ncbi:hypothetical protein THAOC_01746 [Thalassiosira oceanica]|uniref:Uncharacterized protein n=1 Tax=Thalassiosira oceanica TaxID=159749 RepID=K0THK4_THAOC|nr:hypothetical protein THAOC_01746 [Thalassiosira oceanica]|eukprot:EJK76489.1 hypothetical protein THAOC_01746 [Thalassiosira oceanica]
MRPFSVNQSARVVATPLLRREPNGSSTGCMLTSRSCPHSVTDHSPSLGEHIVRTYAKWVSEVSEVSEGRRQAEAAIVEGRSTGIKTSKKKAGAWHIDSPNREIERNSDKIYDPVYIWSPHAQAPNRSRIWGFGGARAVRDMLNHNAPPRGFMSSISVTFAMIGQSKFAQKPEWGGWIASEMNPGDATSPARRKKLEGLKVLVRNYVRSFEDSMFAIEGGEGGYEDHGSEDAKSTRTYPSLTYWIQVSQETNERPPHLPPQQAIVQLKSEIRGMEQPGQPGPLQIHLYGAMDGPLPSL